MQLFTCSLKIVCSMVILCCSSSHILWNNSFLSRISWSVCSISSVNEAQSITIFSTCLQLVRHRRVVTSRCKSDTWFLMPLNLLFKPLIWTSKPRQCLVNSLSEKIMIGKMVKNVLLIIWVSANFHMSRHLQYRVVSISFGLQFTIHCQDFDVLIKELKQQV